MFSKRELLEQVWGFKSPGRTRTLDSHASRLRQKLAIGSDRPWIVNIWGHGYRVLTRMRLDATGCGWRPRRP